MEAYMKKLLFCFSLLLTIISLIVNIGTYVIKNYQYYYSFTFIIHGLIFIPLAIMIFQRRNEFGNKLKIKNLYVNIIKTLIPNGNNIIYIISGICFIYAFINFFVTFQYIANGMAEIIDGKYVLNNHGEITEITKEMYGKQKIYEMRLFSGHWILFSIIPMFYFFYNGIKNNRL